MTLLTPRQLRSYASNQLSHIGTRFDHTAAVGEKAERYGAKLGVDVEVFVNAAWLHDIGYAFPWVHRWHPLAGAKVVSDLGLGSVAAYVAWHSTAAAEAQLLGLTSELELWERRDATIHSAIDWLDMTTGPRGEDCSVEERLEEVRKRHGNESTAYQAMAADQERLLAIDERIRALL